MSHRNSQELKLPLELIFMVIAEIDDTATLDAFIIATADSREAALWEEASKKRWHEVTIKEKDTVELPKAWPLGTTADYALKHAKRPSQISKRGVIDGLLCKSHGIFTASFVKTLTMSMHTDFYDISYRGRKVIRTPRLQVKLLQHTTNLLFPRLCSLESITVRGAAPQELVVAIERLKSPLHAMVFDLAHSPSTWHGDARPPLPQLQPVYHFDWSGLGELHSLRTLKIDLKYASEHDLVERLYLLVNLEQLSLEIAYAKQATMTWFIKRILGVAEGPTNSARQVLPRSLQGLKLTNNCFWTDFQMPNSPDPQGQLVEWLDLPNLERVELTLDLEYAICKRLTRSPIEYLSISGAPAGHLDRALTQAESFQLFHDISGTIEQYQATLKELRIINAWEVLGGLPQLLNEAWVGRYAVTDLVLGTSPFLHPTARSIAIFPGFFARPWNWGKELRRILINEVEFLGFDPDALRAEECKNIKILILFNHPRPNSETPRDRESEELASLKLIKSITKLGIDSLRVLIVGPFRLWLERAQKPGADGKMEKYTRYWDLHRAVQDPEICARIDATMDEADQDFISARYGIVKEVQDVPADSFDVDKRVRRVNYLTLRKVA